MDIRDTLFCGVTKKECCAYRATLNPEESINVQDGTTTSPASRMCCLYLCGFRICYASRQKERLTDEQHLQGGCVSFIV